MSLEVVESHATPSAAAFSVRPFTINLGATIVGLDLSRRPSSETQAALRRALSRHGVLFFRDQVLGTEQLLDVARIFGEPLRHNPYLPSTETTSGVEIIEANAGKRLANESWHADVTWQHDPPIATLLYAAELPPQGGDTVWASSTGAYRSLPPRWPPISTRSPPSTSSTPRVTTAARSTIRCSTSCAPSTLRSTCP